MRRGEKDFLIDTTIAGARGPISPHRQNVKFSPGTGDGGSIVAVMTGISSQAIADAVGISRRAVNKAAHRGHLTRGSDGRFDPEASPNREWIEQRARLRGDGRGRPLPLPAPNGSGTAVEIQTSPEPEAPTELPGPDGGLFSDWTALRVDRDAADRLLGEVPAERVDQIAFLSLMMEGLRAAVAEALAAQREEMRAMRILLNQPVSVSSDGVKRWLAARFARTHCRVAGGRQRRKSSPPFLILSSTCRAIPTYYPLRVGQFRRPWDSDYPLLKALTILEMNIECQRQVGVASG